ncbi:hypothetical protein P280DRAFT_483624 [Massarina eburnea CBS 473.64]|uniref:Uncharacterized protein n=1 Tax=Massarina eburnea CBS 473.64 TaxID=1395130 RepID=A0A6A6RMT0_9PLEO|nr:hypothetical protein P280DRAFT_483624 [Massarina eburnea CBS 473.64]
MTEHRRLVALEAKLDANQREIKELTAKNLELLAKNAEQEQSINGLIPELPQGSQTLVHEILTEDQDNVHPHLSHSEIDLDDFLEVDLSSPAPHHTSTGRVPLPVPHHLGPGPSAGWSANAKEAVHGLRIAFAIRGENDELLEFMIKPPDFGVLLTATLTRNGWSEENIQKAVRLTFGEGL